MDKAKGKFQDKSELLPSLPTNIRLPNTLEAIPVEVSFENIGYFTPSSKRIQYVTTKEKTVAEKIDSDGRKTVLKISIIASGKYGLPITSDLDYYRAFLKILDEIVEQEGQIVEPIDIPVKKIIRYAGKQENARGLREVKDWIRRSHTTTIQGSFYMAEHGDYIEIGDEPLFPRYRLRGQQLGNGKIAETNCVWLASWFRSNYHHHHLRQIDLAFHRRLRKPISKSLFPLLEIGWYAANGKPYTKNYHDLCQEFLLKEYHYLSDIKRQLDPSHHELAQERFLKQWEYRKAANGYHWLITYHAGEKFLEDQHARGARRQLAEQIANRSRQLAPPQLELIDHSAHLLTEILAVCGDQNNHAAYRKVMQEYPEGLLWMALSETRQAAREGRIRKTRGAYFIATLKHLARLRTGAATFSED
jgi:hypothetical protein